MTDRPIRASDREREDVVDVLREAYTDGRLTLDEFEERTSAAYASKTWTGRGCVLAPRFSCSTTCVGWGWTGMKDRT